MMCEQDFGPKYLVVREEGKPPVVHAMDSSEELLEAEQQIIDANLGDGQTSSIEDGDNQETYYLP